jgi:FkbM family methyltransferase
LCSLGVIISDIPYYFTVNYKDKIVLDIGGFLSETSTIFVKVGARKVIYIEPYFENVKSALITFRLNNVMDKVEVISGAIVSPWHGNSKTRTRVEKRSLGQSNLGLLKGTECVDTTALRLDRFIEKYLSHVVR